MAGSIPILGQSNFGALVTSGNQGADAQFYAANSLARTGDLIAKSLAEIQANKEAQQLAPIFRAQYSEGMNEIMSGNVAGGLSRINGTAMQAAQNPLLTRIATESAQAAGYVANNIVDRFSQEARLNFKSKFEEQKQSNRMQLEEFRQQNSQQKDPIAQFSAELRAKKNFDEQVAQFDTSITAAQEAGDEEGYYAAQAQKTALMQQAVDAGLNWGKQPGNEPFVDSAQEAEIAKLRKQIAKDDSEIRSGNKTEGGVFGYFGTDREKRLQEYQRKLKGILDSATQKMKQRHQENGFVGEDVLQSGLPNDDLAGDLPISDAIPQNTQGGYRRAADLFGN